jgi:hypothetical protein
MLWYVETKNIISHYYLQENSKYGKLEKNSESTTYHIGGANARNIFVFRETKP